MKVFIVQHSHCTYEDSGEIVGVFASKKDAYKLMRKIRYEAAGKDRENFLLYGFKLDSFWHEAVFIMEYEVVGAE